MTPLILRLLGAVAGLGSAVLCWIFGHLLSIPLRQGTLFSQGGPTYALMAFILVPALILAVVALFWVPPRPSGGGPIPEGKRWRTGLVLLFAAAFIIGIVW